MNFFDYIFDKERFASFWYGKNRTNSSVAQGTVLGVAMLAGIALIGWIIYSLFTAAFAYFSAYWIPMVVVAVVAFRMGWYVGVKRAAISFGIDRGKGFHNNVMEHGGFKK